LRAAIGKKRFFQSTGCDLRQFLSQLNLRLVGVERRDMLELICLVVNRLSYFFVAVTDADRENATKKIQEFFSLGVINVIALRMIDDQRLFVVRRDARKKVFFLFFNDLVFVHELLLSNLLL